MNGESLVLKISKVDQYARGALPLPRYEHSVRVAELSRELCGRFGMDPEAGYLAGIAHDICKPGKDRWLLSLVARDGMPLAEIERAKPALLHGRAAAVMLSSDFGVSDQSILDAVRHHTFGAPGLDGLGMILFVADKIEPGREGYDEALRKKILSSALPEMTRLVLEDNIRYLERRGKTVSMATLAMLEDVEGRSLS